MPGLRRGAVAALLFVLAACVARPPEPARLDLDPVSFDALPGWRDGRQGEALVAFRRSCARLASRPDHDPLGADALAGTAGDWRAPCAAAPAAGDARARAFFERWFVPFGASDRGAREGLFTGYYEPLLAGARRRGGRYTVPIYGRPSDLVTVDLGLFRPDQRGRRIAGRIETGALLPYPSRGEIERGALAGRAPVIAWVDDAADAFFLHVQGSGRIRLADGEVVRVGYAAGNGHAYVSVGRVLAGRGVMSRDEVTLPAIRAWLAANPEEAREVLGLNPSFVFFRELTGEGPVGAQGAVLTPGRSLAVDRRHLPLGVPVWLDITAPGPDPEAPDRPLRRLVIAQDTGGAIKGAVRGDLFWGFGAEAESIAGRMKHRGRYYILLPRAVGARRER